MIGTTGRGLVTAPRPVPTVARRTGVFSTLHTKPWLYVNFVLLLWALAPEVRRLIDWRASTPVSQIVIALPLLGLIPIALAFVYTPALAYVEGRVLRPFWLWLGGFTSSALIGLAAGNGVGAIYSFLDFFLSAAFGIWMTTLDVAREVLYHKVAGFLLNLALPVSLYGFYQFAILPAWDRAWMLNVHAIAFGLPYPFAFRPFSTLNAPAIFADFLVGVLLLNMPRVARGSNLWRTVKFVVVVAALALTQVRAEWLAAVAGLLTFVVISPGRVKNLGIVGAIAIAIVLFVSNSATIFGSSQAGNDVAKRFSTFGDITQDASYQDRQKYFGAVLTNAIEQPLGGGLGLVGAGARVGTNVTEGVFDNGYIARLTEMGFFGTACFVFALIFAMSLAISRLRYFTRIGNREMAAVAAAAIAVQVAFDFADISGDHHNSVGGTFFWTTLGFLYGRRGSNSAAGVSARA